MHEGLGVEDDAVSRVQLGRMLQSIRVERGLKGQELAALLGISQSQISKFESGKVAFAASMLARIIEALEVEGREADRLRFQFQLTLLPPLSTRVVIANGVASRQRKIAIYEARARLIEQYVHSVVPGLLQTPGYIRAVLRSFQVSPRAIEDSVIERVQRQRILLQQARHFNFLMSEAVLYSVHGSVEAHLEQLQSLRMKLGLRDLRIGFIPLKAGVPARALTGFTIFDSHLVTTETVVVEQAFTDERDVKAFVELHLDLQRRALYDDEARECLDAAIAFFQAKS